MWGISLCFIERTAKIDSIAPAAQKVCPMWPLFAVIIGFLSWLSSYFSFERASDGSIVSRAFKSDQRN